MTTAVDGRFTVVGADRRVDLTLPVDEPVGRLLPDLIRLLGDTESVEARPRGLLVSTGVTLTGDHTLGDAGVLDGAVLRLVPLEHAPAPPVVADVTEAVADSLDLERRPGGRFDDRWLRWAAGGVLVSLAAASALLVVNNATHGAVPALAGAVAGLMVAGGAVLARTSPAARPVALATVVSGGAAAAVVALRAPAAHDLPPGVGPGAALGVLVVTALTLAFLTGFGRTGLVAATGLLGLPLTWPLGVALDLPPERLAALMAVVAVALLGQLPRLVLAAAGLVGLDDAGAVGRTVPRSDVEAALTRARHGLLVATVVVASCATFSAAWLLAAPTVWSAALAGTVGVVLAARSATYPRATEAAALLTAASVVLLLGVDAWAGSVPGFPALPLVALLVSAAALVASLVVRVPEHVAVRLHGHLRHVETLATAAVVPLAVGVFGVFGRLLTVS